MKIVILTNCPSPYKLDQIEALANFCDLHFIFDELSEKNRYWKFNPNTFLVPCIELKGGNFKWNYLLGGGKKEIRQIHFSLGLYSVLRNLSPDLIISSELGSRTIQSLFYCKMHKIPLFVFAEYSSYTERNCSLLRLKLRKFLVRHIDHFFSPGKQGELYLQSFGIPKEKITKYLLGGESSFFLSKADSFLPEKEALKNKLNLKKKVFLFVGSFSIRKGIKEYLQAIDSLPPEKLKEVSFLFVGTGDLQKEMKNFQQEHPYLSFCFIDFVQANEIYRYYAISDFNVLPSLEDVWGVVVLEALVSGLPQLVSTYAGSASDLITEEKFGKVIDPKNTKEFGKKILEFIENPPPRLEKKTREDIAKFFSPSAQAERIFSAIKKKIS